MGAYLTRKEYMDGKGSFNDYYGQFADTMRRQCAEFWASSGLTWDKLRALRVADKHLNNLGYIHGVRWLDAMDRWVKAHSSTIARIRKSIDGTAMYSLSDGACILKTYVYKVLDDEGEGN